eukprot:14594155-Heterocapsa_arctica.AAC.1
MCIIRIPTRPAQAAAARCHAFGSEGTPETQRLAPPAPLAPPSSLPLLSSLPAAVLGGPRAHRSLPAS